MSNIKSNKTRLSVLENDLQQTRDQVAALRSQIAILHHNIMTLERREDLFSEDGELNDSEMSIEIGGVWIFAALSLLAAALAYFNPSFWDFVVEMLL